MFDSLQTEIPTSTSDIEENHSQNFTPLPDFQPPSTIEEPSYAEPSIANPIGPLNNQPDYITKLTEELRTMATQKGLNPDEVAPVETVGNRPLPPPRRPTFFYRLGQGIGNFFRRLMPWNWGRQKNLPPKPTPSSQKA